MKKKPIIILLSSVLIVMLVLIGIKVGIDNNDPNDNNNDNNNDFQPGDYYSSEIMNYMGVVYDERDNITAFNGGYSSSDVCPWNAKHEGIDYFLANGSSVIAAVPGKVIDINLLDHGETIENRYMIHMQIQFNQSFIVDYCFEPWTQNVEDKDHQIALFDVEVGDWVEKGEKIATFLSMDSSAHIHFDNFENWERSCPQRFFGDADYIEIMEMIHSFHPTWDLCYP